VRHRPGQSNKRQGKFKKTGIGKGQAFFFGETNKTRGSLVKNIQKGQTQEI
jgi:hypothetical protein